MPSFFDELKRRHVIKSALAYLVAAWLIVQVLSVLLATFKAPDWVMQAAIIALAVGFPIWIIINWVYDFSSTGLVKTPEKGIDKDAAHRTNTRLNRFIIAALSLAVVLLVFNQVRLNSISGLEGSGDVVIAVLPFDNLSPEEENDWIGDGFMNDLYAQLTKVGSFKVIHPISTIKYKDSDKNLPDIINELGVSHLLFGNIRKADDQMMVSAQLIDREEHNLWNENYRDSTEDIFEVQLKVAKASSIAVMGALTQSQEKRIDGSQKVRSEAQFYLVQALRLLEQSSSKELKSTGIWASEEYFEKALEIQPDMEEALSGLSYVLAWKQDTRRKADSLATTALELNPFSDMASAAKAIVMFNLFGKKREAIELLERTTKLNPSATCSHEYLARLLSNEPYRDADKAVYHAEQAISLNPFFLNLYKVYGGVLADAKQYGKVDSLVMAYKGILDENSIQNIISTKLFALSRDKFQETKDYNSYIEVFKQAVIDNPDNQGVYYCLISRFYDQFFYDQQGRLNNIEKAWKLRKQYVFPDSDLMAKFMLPEEYFMTLLGGANLEEALNFSRSKEVQAWFNNHSELYEDWLNYTQFNYHLNRGEFNLAESYTRKNFAADGKLFVFGHLDRSHYQRIYLMARRGETEEVLNVLKRDTILKLPVVKAELFSVLRQRDSLFFYLDQLNQMEAWEVNSWPEIDPYRSESAYIAFRKKHYLKDITVD